LTHLLTEDASKERPAPGVDTYYLPLAVHLSDLDLIGDDEAPANQINKVSSEEVLSEQQLARTTLKTSKVDLPAFKGHTTGLQAPDLSDWHEEVPPLDLDHRAHERRVRVIAESRDQVLDASYSVAVRIEDRTTQKCREMENFGHGTP
jgi:hypothetical protein